MKDEKSLPPYAFCDGGQEDTSEHSEGEEMVTVKLPKTIKVGMTRADGSKIEKEINPTEEDPAKLAAYISQGVFMPQRLGEFNELTEIRARELAEQRSSSVEETVKKILAAKDEEKEPVIDEDALKNGDFTTLIAWQKWTNNRSEKIKAELQKEREQTKAEREEQMIYNSQIDKTLKEFPSLTEKFLLESLKGLGLSAQAIYPFGEIIANLLKQGVNIDKMPVEQKKKLFGNLKKELEAPEPPPEGGAPALSKSEEKEKEEKMDLSLDGLMKKANEIADEWEKTH